MEELLENLIPLYNKEFYLACLCGENVVLPIPDGNAERYLAYLCGMDVTIPDVPDGRTETYLAYKCGEDVVLPDPMYRIEFYLAKWCGMDVEVPEPLYRIEYWLAQLANSGELKTVTGNPISISDALAKPAEALTIEILPQQDLHGYDSPWPAGGGENLIDFTTAINDGWTKTIDSVTASYNNGVMTVTGTNNTAGWISFNEFSSAWTDDPIVLGAGTYIMSNHLVIPASVDGAAYDNKSNSFTAETSVSIRGFYVAVSAGSTVDWTIPLMLVRGTTRPTTYSPYSNICPITGYTGVNIYRESAYDPDADPTYSIDWTDEAGTVYGGTLDVTTGVLTVDRAMVDMGNFDWQIGGSGGKLLYTRDIQGILQHGNAVSSQFLNFPNIAVNAMESYGQMSTSESGRLYVYNGGMFADAASFKAAMSGVQLVYELATPLTIQLTPTQVDMLLGNNVLWNDVDGDMTLEYLADGPADDVDALQILLGNRYVNNGEADEATDREALEILLGGNTR